MKYTKFVMSVLISFSLMQPALASKAIPDSLVGQWKYDGEMRKYPALMTISEEGIITDTEYHHIVSETSQGWNVINCVMKTEGKISKVVPVNDGYSVFAENVRLVEMLYPALGSSAEECKAFFDYAKTQIYSRRFDAEHVKNNKLQINDREYHR